MKFWEKNMIFHLLWTYNFTQVAIENFVQIFDHIVDCFCTFNSHWRIFSRQRSSKQTLNLPAFITFDKILQKNYLCYKENCFDSNCYLKLPIFSFWKISVFGIEAPKVLGHLNLYKEDEVIQGLHRSTKGKYKHFDLLKAAKEIYNATLDSFF